MQLHRPLHTTRYYLNPEYFYPNSDRIMEDTEVLNGLYKCIQRLIPSLEVQDMITDELIKYKNADGLFGLPMAIRQRSTKGPGIIFIIYFILFTLFKPSF